MRLIPMVLASLLVSAAPALAGHGGNGGSTSSTLQLVLLNPTPGGPYYKDKVTFNVSTTATSEPWVTVTCTQNGTVVYTQSQGFFPSYLYGQIFSLGPTAKWTGGAADCTATLWKVTSNNRRSTLASIAFHVSA